MSLGTPMRRRVRDSYAVEDSYDIDHKRWASDGAEREAPDAYASLISLPSEGHVLWVRGGFWVLVRYGSLLVWYRFDVGTLCHLRSSEYTLMYSDGRSFKSSN